MSSVHKTNLQVSARIRAGLIAVMRAEQKIGEITGRYIEVYRDDRLKGRLVQRFYRKVGRGNKNE